MPSPWIGEVDEGVIGETMEHIELLKQAKQVQLLEPNYKRKYPPLGLAKIASFVKANGGEVRYTRQPTNYGDVIATTSLFTFHSHDIEQALSSARFLNPQATILLGGIAASLLNGRFDTLADCVFKGCDETLDSTVPDYSIDWQVEDPWDKFAYLFTARGCPNRCPYCAVWRIEPKQMIVENWRDHIVASKPYVMVSDNNLSALPESHIKAVVDCLVERKKKVVFDNGFDCKFITTEMAQELARLSFTRCGMRMAFDRIEEDGQFQVAIERLLSAGIPKSQVMAYVLFNFNDTPKEAFYRMSECRRLGIRPYPQQYEPLGELTRDKRFIGKHWTQNMLKAFRYYWLMAGVYTKHEFNAWLQANRQQYKLTDEEMERLNAAP